MRVSFIAICLLLPFAAGAADVQYAVEGGGIYSDNIRKTDIDRQDETILVTATEFSFADQRPRLNTKVVGTLAYEDYLKNSYDGQVLGAVDAAGSWAVIPEKLNWLLQDNFGQTLQDLFASDTPDNREYVNYITTGPDFAIHLSAANEIRLGARYSRVDYQKSPFDNQRFGGAVSFVHKLSAESLVSANIEREGVNFDSSSTATDFTRDAGFVRFEADGARSQLQLDGGYNQVRADAHESLGGGLLRGDFSRKVGRFSTLSFIVGRELTESGNTLRFQQDVANVSLDALSLPDTADPFRRDSVAVSFDTIGRRTGITIGASHEHETFERLDGPDRDRNSGSLMVSRDLTPRTTVRASGIYLSDRLRTNVEKYTEVIWRGEVDWRIDRRLYFDVLLEHANRDANIAANGYTETRGYIRLRFGAATVQGIGTTGLR